MAELAQASKSGKITLGDLSERTGYNTCFSTAKQLYTHPGVGCDLGRIVGKSGETDRLANLFGYISIALVFSRFSRFSPICARAIPDPPHDRNISDFSMASEIICEKECCSLQIEKPNADLGFW